MRSFILIFILGIVIAACSSKTTPTSGTTKSTPGYSEDLSVLRPKIPVDTAKTSTANQDGKKNPTQYVEPKVAINSQLDAVLDSIDRINVSHRVVDGFTIQIYSGVKREDALNTKKQLSSTVPDLNAEIQFVQPNFRVRAGKYYTRLEAQKDYLAIKKHFPNAIVIPERISIN
jgi:hypothetical protein